MRIYGLTDYCLTSSEQCFSYIQDDNKFNNINYIEMRKGMGKSNRVKDY